MIASDTSWHGFKRSSIANYYQKFTLRRVQNKYVIFKFIYSVFQLIDGNFNAYVYKMIKTLNGSKNVLTSCQSISRNKFIDLT